MHRPITSLALLTLALASLSPSADAIFGLGKLWRAIKGQPSSHNTEQVGGNACAVAMSPSTCAVIYEDHGCHGWAYPLSAGYLNLEYSRKNAAQSVKVRSGCSFTGFDHKSTHDHGRSVKVDADGGRGDVSRDLYGSGDLQKAISAVSCACQQQQQQQQAVPPQQAAVVPPQPMPYHFVPVAAPVAPVAPGAAMMAPPPPGYQYYFMAPPPQQQQQHVLHAQQG